jgi:hypothetical protein
MKNIFSILFFLAAFNAFSFGKHGWYNISGKVFAENNTVLKNALLIITIGDDKKAILTNGNGEYEIKVHWAFPCRPKRLRDLFRNGGSPKCISVAFSDKEVKIRNRWKKQARKNDYKSPGKAKHKDLVFV